MKTRTAIMTYLTPLVIVLLPCWALYALTLQSARDSQGRDEWSDVAAPRGCSLFPTAYWGELRVSEVRGPSNVQPGFSQEIKPGDFRLDQYSPERDDFVCQMILRFRAGRLQGPVKDNTAHLNEVLEGRLTEAELILTDSGLKVRLVGTTQRTAQITRRGVLHPIPLGFSKGSEFDQFGAILATYLSRVLRKLRPGEPDPIRGVEVYVRGSSVKGRSSKSKAPFDSKQDPSDIDLDVVSPHLFEEGKRLGCNVHDGRRLSENCEELEGRPRPQAGEPGYPELAEMRRKLSELLNPNLPDRFKDVCFRTGEKCRPVNYVVSKQRGSLNATIKVPGFSSASTGH